MKIVWSEKAKYTFYNIRNYLEQLVAVNSPKIHQRCFTHPRLIRKKHSAWKIQFKFGM